MTRFEEAIDEIKNLTTKEASELRANAEFHLSNASLSSCEKIKTEEIVVTCPSQCAYEWDSEGYKTKGYGGSETAAVEMMTWIAKYTGRKIKIFMPRKIIKSSASSVSQMRLLSKCLTCSTSIKMDKCRLKSKYLIINV
jgi:hypothetical protein